MLLTYFLWFYDVLTSNQHYVKITFLNKMKTPIMRYSSLQTFKISIVWFEKMLEFQLS